MKSHCYLILQFLVQPDGSLISAKGLEYDGPDLNYQSAGIVLLSAIYESFTLGTILILRQQKDWVGRVRKWPILMIPKGQIISKAIFVFLTSSKKRTKKI